MQNRYTGDIGDFAKFGLLRALGQGQRLGIAWYLYPDEDHNKDGRHIAYLDDPKKWRHLDPDLFDGMRKIVFSGDRDIHAIEISELLGDAIFSNELLSFTGSSNLRANLRADWFKEVMHSLVGANLVFADPDNGLYEDHKYMLSNIFHWKRIPPSEVTALSTGRTSVIYHHNTRASGGHLNEIQHWIDVLGEDTIALYWRRISNRTFFIVNPSEEIRLRAHAFSEKWSPHFQTVSPANKSGAADNSAPLPSFDRDRSASILKVCPECGHTFQGNGWGGIDAHWKANHDHIMPYSEAWPQIRLGERPSTARE